LSSTKHISSSTAATSVKSKLSLPWYSPNIVRA
jgi:hypothetical protein